MALARDTNSSILPTLLLPFYVNSEAYLIKERCIRRSFISVRNLLQAEIMNQTVTWIVPHERTTLFLLMLISVSCTPFGILPNAPWICQFQVIQPGWMVIPLARPCWDVAKLMMNPPNTVLFFYLKICPKFKMKVSLLLVPVFSVIFTFFLSREVPRHSLAMLIQSAGGVLGWEALDESSPLAEDSPAITITWLIVLIWLKCTLIASTFQPSGSLTVSMRVKFWTLRCTELEPCFRLTCRLRPSWGDGNGIWDCWNYYWNPCRDRAKKLAVSMLSKKKKLYESMQRGHCHQICWKGASRERRAEIAQSEE